MKAKELASKFEVTGCILNLSAGYNPLGLSEDDHRIIHFESFFFSGGEPHIKIIQDCLEKLDVLITVRINSFNDMGMLLVATDALKRLGVNSIHLLIAYMPGARQDRVMVKGESLTVKVYADVINSMNFESVSIFDPHSDVAPALLTNCHVIDNHKFVEKAVHSFESDGWNIVSPDSGANKKIGSLCKYLGVGSYIRCDKTRDLNTGKLSGFEVYADDLEGKTCIIVDDICDGGGTFIGLAKELKNKNAGDLYLIVSHGIFSKGFGTLNNIFKGIYTTDSFAGQREGSNVHEIKLKEVLTIK